MKRKRYSKEEYEEALHLLKEKSLSEVHRILQIPVSTLHSWAKGKCKPFCISEKYANAKKGSCTTWTTENHWSKNAKEREAVIKKISASLKGRKVWNEGLTKETDERIETMAKKQSRVRKRMYKEGKLKKAGFQKGYDKNRVATQFKKGVDERRGKPFTGKEGDKYIVNTGKTRFKKGIPIEEQIGVGGDKKRKERVTNAIRNKWKNDDIWAEKMLRKLLKSQCHKKSNLEIKMEELLEEYYPKQWKYVGDFSCFIGRKCPDFINVNGQKKLIEVFGRYWHTEEDEPNRINHFNKYGFKTLVVWEDEFKDEGSLLNKLRGFMDE